MPTPKGTLRICKKGHKYYKSSDCPVCPICVAEEQPEEEILDVLGAPPAGHCRKQASATSNNSANGAGKNCCN